MKLKSRHDWFWDWPWDVVRIGDWFYMVNSESDFWISYTHVRVFGIRSRWIIKI